MGFTDNQIKAIETSGSDVLVSAAAGSGKTTVLVERIIRRILNEEDPIDIDRMLVLTFTKAAASQMRDKILKAIEEKLSDDPENGHLVRQSMLVHNAQISTFHGFCQEIIKNHFYEIDMDPQLRVADEGEVKLLQMDALSKILEEAYEDGKEDFLRVVESYGGGRNDKSLEDIILKIYRLAQAQPSPDKYLSDCEDSYYVEKADDIKSRRWFKDYFEFLKSQAKDAVSIGRKMIMLCDSQNGPLKYRPMYEDDLNYAIGLAEAKNYEEMSLLCGRHSKMKLATITAKEAVDSDLKELSKNLRDRLYKITDGIKSAVLKSLEEEVPVMKAVSGLNHVLIELTRAFGKEYAQMKQDKGLIDFNDMEHFAIQILKNGDGATARAYRDRFVEIYVDEYQDSNLTQEELIRLISNDNVFMVGDVKQSIYRFRMARPDLFLGKFKSFSTDINADISDIDGYRIDLSDNFRSRSEVLDSANEVFFEIMTESLGGIKYDDAASLHYGHLYDNYLGDEYKSELILASSDGDLSDAECEATAIATRIRQLVGNLDIVDESTKKLIKLKYSDIVILLRSMTGRDNIYRDTLSSFGIPAYVTTGGGYFASIEIETLLCFLAIIDNPLQDIPLASVLRSVIGGFTDEELAKISSSKNKYLYDSLMNDSSDKSKSFLKLLDHYREESDYLSVYEILREIIDGGYGDIVRSRSNGKQAEANLNMLLKKAEDFGKLSYKGLFHFLRYIDQIRKYEIDYGEAGITDEADDNVRIMTIHKSKGLEFPVVFVSALSKKRNTTDERAEIITDPDLGLGLNNIDLEKRLKKSTLLRDCMISRLKMENLAEEIRVLYVAVTRAKEKLIMVARSEDPSKEFYEIQKPLTMCESYLDIMAYAYGQKGILKHTHVIEMGPKDYILEEMERRLEGEDRMEYLKVLIDTEKNENTGLGEDKIARDIKKRLQFVYPHYDEAPKHSKVSVSELKKTSMEAALDREDKANAPDAGTEDLFPKRTLNEAYIPDFIRESVSAPTGGTFYGTAFHRMAELWNYSEYEGREDGVTEQEVSSYFEKMCDKGLIDRVQLDAVSPGELVKFIKTDAAKRMGRADRRGLLYREQPFTFGEEPGPMLVQGIIDVYWIEDGEIVILDYKTDRVNEGNQLVERYHVQLEYYEKALTQLLNMPVKDKLIYSTRLCEVIRL